MGKRDYGLVHFVDRSWGDCLTFAAHFKIDLARNVGVLFAPEQGFLNDTNSGSRLRAGNYGSGMWIRFSTVWSQRPVNGRDFEKP